MKDLTDNTEFQFYLRAQTELLKIWADYMMYNWLKLASPIECTDNPLKNFDFKNIESISSLFSNKKALETVREYRFSHLVRFSASFPPDVLKKDSFKLPDDDSIKKTIINLYIYKEKMDEMCLDPKEKKALYWKALYLTYVSSLYKDFEVSKKSVGIDSWVLFHNIDAIKEEALMNCSEIIGYWNAKGNITDSDLKQFHTIRTAKSTLKKREHRKIREKKVYEAYLKMVRDKPPEDRIIIAAMSEHKLAKIIKEMIKDDLHYYGKDQKSGRQKLIKLGISEETIIDILRNRDKNKFPWYPWEKVAKM